jgi:hypothetical protein
MMATDRDGAAAAATQAGLDQVQRTLGHVPDGFRILAEHAPEAFIGSPRDWCS